MIVTNAFSLNMLPTTTKRMNVRFEVLGVEEAKRLLSDGYESAVGHADTAAVFSRSLGVQLEARRVTFKMREGDRILVGQYTGPRLPEGATALPEGATITWWLVTPQ